MSNFKQNPVFFSPHGFLSNRSIGIESASKTKLINHRFTKAKNLYRRDLGSHFGCVNAIEFSHGHGEWIASGGDDRRVLLWNVEEAMDNFKSPMRMKGEHHSNIFCLAFDDSNKKIYSGGNDEQVIVHDATTGATLDVFLHEDAVYGLSVDPLNGNIFASACDDGRVLIYDTRAPPDEDPFCLANYVAPMHAVMFNPAEPRLVATANSREGLGLWDVRKPRSCLIRYGGSLSRQSCMSVRISRTGDKVLGLRRRLPPVVYNLHSAQTLHQFDHSGYYNSCTMKSCCFAGDKDQYIISGSDDFNLYVWKIPEEGCKDWVGEAHLVLHGHRSIVNQVRFNPANHMIISSGVEKVIKVWSPFPLFHGSGDLGLCPETDERQVYTHEQYINLVLRSGQLMTHDYTLESTDEDPRMMAFFDSLVQRELEGWSSEDSFSSHSPLRDSYVQSDSSLRSSPNVTVDLINSAAADAVLRFFSPVNAITNRSTTISENANTANNQQTTGDGISGNTNTYQSGLGTILDMDHQIPNVINDLITSSSPNDDSNSQNVVLVQSSGVGSNGSDLQVPTNTVSGSSRTDPAVPTANGTVYRRLEQFGNISSTVSIPTNSTEPLDIDVPSTSGIEPDVNNRAESYRSISELIQQKRKEYLLGIKKLEKRATRRKIRYLTRRKEKLKRIRHRLLLSSMECKESSESDSDKEACKNDTSFSSDDSDMNSDSNSTSSTSSSLSSGESAYQNNTGLNIVKEVVEKRKSKISNIQRFKKLRQRALNSDSGSDTHDILHDSVKTAYVRPSSSVSQPSGISCQKNGQSSNCDYIPIPVYEDISNDSCPENDGTEKLMPKNNGSVPALENVHKSLDLSTDSCNSNGTVIKGVVNSPISNDALPASSLHKCYPSSNGANKYPHCVPNLPLPIESSISETLDTATSKDEKPCNGCKVLQTSMNNLDKQDANVLSSSSNISHQKDYGCSSSNGQNINGDSSNATSEATGFKKVTEKQKVKRRNYRKRDSSDVE